MSTLPPNICSPLPKTATYEDVSPFLQQQPNKLTTAAEHDFNVLAALASIICEAPFTLISLVDSEKPWFKAGIGIEMEDIPFSVSFCRFAIEQEDVLEVCDTTSDIRFFQNTYVTGQPNIRFYAGTPLVNKDGYKLGTLCVLDLQPRELSEKQRLALATLSEQVVAHLELREVNWQSESKIAVLEATNQKLQQDSAAVPTPELAAAVNHLKTLTEKMSSTLLANDITAAFASLSLLKKQLAALEASL